MEQTDVVLEEQIRVSPEARRRYVEWFGSAYEDAEQRLRNAVNQPIASLFKLPTNDKGKVKGKIKTEILFIERCLDLLKPGGRMGIVLPEGIFNNPSLAGVREFVEDRARLLAVVSLPQETFMSSGASVKASLLFLQKFTVAEQAEFDKIKGEAKVEVEGKYAPEIAVKKAECCRGVSRYAPTEDRDKAKSLQKELDAFLKETAAKVAAESRTLLKQRFSYPVFLYEADYVGISSTGDTSASNELYPNDRTPPGCVKTCLELYREFLADPTPFFVNGPGK